MAPMRMARDNERVSNERLKQWLLWTGERILGSATPYLAPKTKPPDAA
jgi:hypothetical protein